MLYIGFLEGAELSRGAWDWRNFVPDLEASSGIGGILCVWWEHDPSLQNRTWHLGKTTGLEARTSTADLVMLWSVDDSSPCVGNTTARLALQDQQTLPL